MWLVIRLLNNSDIFIFAKGRFPGSLDLSQNLLSFGSPDVTLGIEVMLGEVLHNSVNQLAHAAEAAGQDRLLDPLHGRLGGSQLAVHRPASPSCPALRWPRGLIDDLAQELRAHGAFSARAGLIL